MNPLPPPVPYFTAALVLIAAFSDLRSRTIPNWLTLGGIVAGLAMHSYLTGWSGLQFSATGLGVAALVFLPIFMMRWLGGGDVKLWAAVGALTGATNLIVIFIFDSFLGGAAALIAVITRGRSRKTLHNICRIISALLHGKAPYQVSPELEAGTEESMGMPHAATIAAATLFILWAATLPAPTR
ncbi:MAG TPA: A24 family peptidase [Paludibaculum sp.]|jgi:prepilin peptidase CpaA